MSNTNDAEANVEIFNRVVAQIFVELYDSFPVPIRIPSHSIAEKLLGKELFWTTDYLRGEGAREETKLGRHYCQIAYHSISWLTECGYMLQRANKEDYILSPKGFEALAAVPTSLSTKETRSLGKQLTSAVATVGDRASTAVISNIIGQVIGAAGRSLIAPGLTGI